MLQFDTAAIDEWSHSAPLGWYALRQVGIVMKPLLANNSTIRTLSDGLRDGLEFVRRILAAMVVHKSDQGLVQVRVSLQGNPGAPDYRIEAVISPETGRYMVLEGYRGKTHKPMPSNKVESGFWSESVSTVSDIQDLLGGLRQQAKPT